MSSRRLQSLIQREQLILSNLDKLENELIKYKFADLCKFDTQNPKRDIVLKLNGLKEKISDLKVLLIGGCKEDKALSLIEDIKYNICIIKEDGQKEYNTLQQMESDLTEELEMLKFTSNSNTFVDVSKESIPNEYRIPESVLIRKKFHHRWHMNDHRTFLRIYNENSKDRFGDLTRALPLLSDIIIKQHLQNYEIYLKYLNERKEKIHCWRTKKNEELKKNCYNSDKKDVSIVSQKDTIKKKSPKPNIVAKKFNKDEKVTDETHSLGNVSSTPKYKSYTPEQRREIKKKIEEYQSNKNVCKSQQNNQISCVSYFPKTLKEFQKQDEEFLINKMNKISKTLPPKLPTRNINMKTFASKARLTQPTISFLSHIKAKNEKVEIFPDVDLLPRKLRATWRSEIY